ncbi:peptidase S8/S53 domain-containing protein [Haematococcus lacustris]
MGLLGIAAVFGPGALEQLRLQYKASIDHIERDTAFQLGDELIPYKAWLRDDEDGRRRQLPEQLDAPWGLDMLDQRTLQPDHIYHYTNNGTGVHVYMLDTGIRSSHTQFLQGQPSTGHEPNSPAVPLTPVQYGQTVVGSGNSVAAMVQGSGRGGVPGTSRVGPGFSAFGTSTEDCHGHGTHVAAVVGGLDFGVAKNVTLHPVQVLDCGGSATATSIVQGLEWVLENMIQPAVVHMSIEGSINSLVNAAVEELVATANVPVVVSAGNNNVDACRVSPASVGAVVTVAAVAQGAVRWPRSNWGPCVDMFAPGASIQSAVNNDDSATMQKTGTSMAAPFVTGVVALYLERNPGANDVEVKQKLNYWATASLVTEEVPTVAQDAYISEFSETQYGSASEAPNSANEGWAAPPLLHRTPNRLLSSLLQAPVHLTPGMLVVNDSDTSFSVQLQLSRMPTASVMVTLGVPVAWDGTALASLSELRFSLQPSSDNSSWTEPPAKVLTLRPAKLCSGTYFVTATLSSDDPFFDQQIHTLKVVDLRPLTGETGQDPRVVNSLPFVDSGTTRFFKSNYMFNIGGGPSGGAAPGAIVGNAPDIVWSYTSPVAQSITVSSCGSSFDTILAVACNDIKGPGSFLTDDDDPTCIQNPSNSRIDTTLVANATYYIILKGFAGAQGPFRLSVTQQVALY